MQLWMGLQDEYKLRQAVAGEIFRPSSGQRPKRGGLKKTMVLIRELLLP